MSFYSMPPGATSYSHPGQRSARAYQSLRLIQLLVLTGILDHNHCQVRQRLQILQVLFVEASYLLALYIQNTEHLVFIYQWHGQTGPGASIELNIIIINTDIRDQLSLLAQRCSSADADPPVFQVAIIKRHFLSYLDRPLIFFDRVNALNNQPI